MVSPSLNAETRLERAGFVVQTGVDNFRVSRSRALTNRPLSLAHQHLEEEEEEEEAQNIFRIALLFYDVP